MNNIIVSVKTSVYTGMWEGALGQEVATANHYLYGNGDEEHAEHDLIKLDVFRAIRLVMEYDRRGGRVLDIDDYTPAIIANHVINIMVEFVYQGSASITANWDKPLTREDIDNAVSEIDYFMMSFSGDTLFDHVCTFYRV